MSFTEKTFTIAAALLAVLGVVLLVLGQNVLGATLLALGAAVYAYATTPHDGDERIR